MRKLTRAYANDFYSLNLYEEVLRFTADKPFQDLQTAVDFLTNYATETAKNWLNIGFSQLKIEKIVGRVMKENIGSIRVLEVSCKVS